MDPDFNHTGGMSFAWYCRDVEDREFQISELDTEPFVSRPDTVPDPDVSDSKSCIVS